MDEVMNMEQQKHPHSGITDARRAYRVFHNVPPAVPGGETDLAAENLVNDWDLTEADLQDL